MAHSVSTIKSTLEHITLENNTVSKTILDNSIDLQPDTYAFLRHLFQILSSKYNKKHHSYVEYSGLPNEHLRSQRAHYFPSHIQDHISNASCTTYQYELKISKRNIVIDIVCFKEVDYEGMKHEDIVNMIYCWLHIATNKIPPTCSRNLHIYLYLTDFKKILPIRNEDPILVNNANSAYTTSCDVNTNIVIYRKEEWFKVFVHETFHCLGLDFSHHNFNSSRILNEHFQFSNIDYKVFESYCETWARIINVCFSAFISLPKESQHNRGENFMEYCTQFSYYIYYETMFSALQMNSVLRHNRLQYSDIIIHKGSQTKIEYREDTSVISYYVFTSILMNNFQKFIEWCSSNHKEEWNLFQFDDTKQTIESFCKFIIELSESSDILALQSLLAHESYTPSYNTMMMTYIPISIKKQFDVIL